MSDLIDRRAAIDRINKQREHLEPDVYPQDKIGDAAYRICAEFIERLPSVQPEIIRCKDCKYWMRAYLSISGKHGCNIMRDYTAPDDYCFKAERKA